ncbi:hypothetical protein Lfu02_26280 [Longispora fulva]|uniref:Uncharacterized protein n=1 Tax=Longispora fulva TaxID=619741 RepID=A0A8J7GIL8_9ACTN|nr:hypothetical protein [Longispora fulva]MBG6138761.1 hypothetical protein [Longispora fulva]GIG58256.1 hypothetical protein Lfu02_26280 [Longispora fulva]
MDETVYCALCDRDAEDPPLDGWALQLGPGGRLWLCAFCARANLLAIEDGSTRRRSRVATG